MKQLLVSLMLAFAVVSYAQQGDLPKEDQDAPVQTQDGPVMTFETTTVDYGTIDRGSEPLRSVNFTNTGNEPLIIKHAKGSCGCTVPIWPKEPIMPGETSQIEIRYDTKRIGVIRKTVKITTNEGGDPHVLQVVGKINSGPKEKNLPEKDFGITGGDEDGGK